MKKSLVLLMSVAIAITSFAQDLTQVIDKVSPSIFLITTYDASGNEYAQGTGFFIGSDGTCLSNYHVFQGASKAKIKTSDGRVYNVNNVMSWSSESDMLKFTIKNELNEVFPALKIATVPPKIGEHIFIMGNPLGLEKSVADGIVSAVRHEDPYGEVIQITAPISHGNSGSPLMNMSGEVFGIVTYFLSEGQQLNFAVSLKNMNVMDDINALKFPLEDGQTTTTTTTNNGNDNSNTTTTSGDEPNTFYYVDSKVIFCEDVDASNNPHNEATSFTIPATGGYLTIYVDNADKPFNITDLTVNIYKKGSGSDYDDLVDTKYYTISKTNTATFFEYTFYSKGDYMVEVNSGSGTWINTGYVTINMDGDNSSSSSGYDYNDPNSTFYFIDSKVQFCTDVDSHGKAIDPGSTYYIDKSSGSYVYCAVENPKPFSTDQLTVKIYKKKGKDYDELYDTKYYTISSDETDIYFKYSFYEAGDYQFKVYTKADVWVNDGYVTIKYD